MSITSSSFTPDSAELDYSTESSDDSETTFLRAPNDISSLAKLILDPRCRSIAFLTGAGVSERSELFHGMSSARMNPRLMTATPEQLEMFESDPKKFVSWETFQENPLPYLEIRRPFILGLNDRTSRPTITHRFMELLHTKTGKLTRIYTQNIDGLDEQCEEIPPEKVVHLRGTISQAVCEGCNEEMDFGAFSQKMSSNIKDIYSIDPTAPQKSSPIHCPSCGKGLVKPKTVLFGRNAPEEYYARVNEDLPSLDLLIIAGTSLFIPPASSLFDAVSEETCRVVVNSTKPAGKELAGDGNGEGRDFFLKGDCDVTFLDLIEELGWIDDLFAVGDLLPDQSQALLGAKIF